MKRLLLFFLTCSCSFSGFSELFIRYNHAGYSPQREAKIVLVADENLSGAHWKVLDAKNNEIHSGKVGRSATGKSKHTSHPFNHIVTLPKLKNVGTYTFEVQGEKATLEIKDQPYAFIPTEILRYIRVMRSASAHGFDQEPGHFGDSLCVVFRRNGTNNEDWSMDPSRKMMDMQGGWYDAGDYIKFTLTTSYAAYQMLRAYELNPEVFQTKEYSQTAFNDLLDEAKWGLDYLMKTYADTNEFIIQTGGSLDHQQGIRFAKDDVLDGRRECYSNFSPTQMGYTAAALALGARLFKQEGHEELAASYLQRSEAIFQKALNYSEPAWFQKDWEIFYQDESIADNMELAATELFKSTGEKDYLNKAKKYAQQAGPGYWASWGTSNMMAHLALIPHNGGLVNFIFEDMENFGHITEQPGNVWGLPHEYTWGSLYSFLGVANAGLTYDDIRNKSLYRKTCYNVLDYTLGMNNWGIAFVASKKMPGTISKVYSQTYQLQPDLFPTGAVAEGPGDRPSHEDLKKYFEIPEDNPFDAFNTSEVVFYDNNTNFQTMETTITGLSEGLLFFAQIAKLDQPSPQK